MIYLKKRETTANRICEVIGLVSLMIFLVAGIVFDLWSKAWVVFPVAVFVGELVRILFGKRDFQSILSFIVWIAAIAAYVLLKIYVPGFEKSYIVFIIALLVCGIFGVLFRKDGKDNVDTQ